MYGGLWHDFIYGANVFLLHSGTCVDAKQMWKCKDENYNHAAYTIFFTCKLSLLIFWIKTDLLTHSYKILV